MVAVNSIEEAATLVSKASRIMVVGSSGGGKTTLSQGIASHRGVEYFSIDRDVRWISGWTQRERGEQLRILKDIVRRDRWLLDGSGPSTFDIRLPRTDIVIWMRLPRITCLVGVAKRVARHYGTVRPYMAEGCREPIPDREFLSCIWNFEKRHAPVFLRNFELYGPDVPIFQVKSRAQARQLLDLVRAAH
ncbi:AAA family ATPase [Rhizobium sp. Leaf262]|uniref:AAA family ATPase n=1 Tax=Rhizobium sp. Leaf262 TaxID=1736312 RepID=UPI00071394B5|nr:AAA family ATPase [Rhizobium sp. Leaf262]KQO80981.1 AAA family ATPase [Rhizobium sp. Leaf262]